MATIHYTINGKTPTTNSSVYFAPTTVSVNEAIRVIARASGYTNNTAASAAYVIHAAP
jgi:hypothetical protein